MTAYDAGSSETTNRSKFFLLPFQALRWLIHQIFGELFWRPPRWAESVGHGVGAVARGAWRHPIVAIGSVAVLAALIAGWVWWQA
ncbi:MAG: hypothetical protein FWC42_10890, partial [Proteobacteria bacterium]|nr:hypothetical protein [Pseudomonadota bacterium]